MRFQFAIKKEQKKRRESAFSPKKTVTQPSPVHRVLRLQRTIGNQGVLRLLKSDLVRVSRPGDKYEREADRVAEMVMRMPGYGIAEKVPVLKGVHGPKIQRHCHECREGLQRQALEEEDQREARPKRNSHLRKDRRLGEEETELRADRAHAEDGNAFASTGSERRGKEIQSGIDKLRGGGRSLPGTELSFFEPRFGVDFSRIRIHTGSRADRLARSVQARAFTVSNHIVFRSNEFQPGTHKGRSLLAHELTHTVQQGVTARKTAQQATGYSGKQRPVVDRITTFRFDTGRAVQRAVTNLAVAGAVAEAGHANHFVAARRVGPVTLTASVSAAGQRVNWTGGRRRPGNNLQRLAPVGRSRTITITADTPADPGAQSVNIHVVDGRVAAANTPAQLGFSRQQGNPLGLAPFGLTDIRTNNPTVRIRACLAGNQWVFRVERIRHRYLMGVTSGGNTNIRSAASATRNNHCGVITDLTPPAAGAATGPPRATFWSRGITLAHERAHVARFYSPGFWEAFMRTAETNIEAAASNVNVDHTAPATLRDRSVVAANAAAHQAIINAQHVAADAAEIGGAEVFAHGQSNPMYTTLISQIGARFRPLAPSALAVAALGPTRVRLTWTDNACNETEYRVYRRRGPGAFAQVATLPAGTATFTDTLAGLATATNFTYHVTAVGVAGESSRSNRAQITTP